MTEQAPSKRKPRSREARAAQIRKCSENARKLREFDRLLAMVDALLNHCDKDGGECRVCSQIVCPHKDPLHFHHDGCPSCYQEEAARAAQPPPVVLGVDCPACGKPMEQHTGEMKPGGILWCPT